MIETTTTGNALNQSEVGTMSAEQFEALAGIIGPEAGPAHEALSAYFVAGMTKAEAARFGRIARSTMTKYVFKWESKLAMLASVKWDVFLQRYRPER